LHRFNHRNCFGYVVDFGCSDIGKTNEIKKNKYHVKNRP